MKKAILILTLAFAVMAAYGQRQFYSGAIYAPVGSDTTISVPIKTDNSYSIHYWYKWLDAADGVLTLYGSNFHPDSAAYALLFIDKDGDSVNDNPFTLSDSSLIIYGDAYPFRWYIQKFTGGSNTAGLPIYVNGVR